MRFKHIQLIAGVLAAHPLAGQQPFAQHVQLRVVASESKRDGTPWDGPNQYAIAATAVGLPHRGNGLLFAKLESKPDIVAAFIDENGRADVRFTPRRSNLVGTPMSPCQDLGRCDFEFSPNHPMGVLLFDADFFSEHDFMEAFVLTPNLEGTSQDQVELLTKAILATARRLNIKPTPNAEKIPILQVSELSRENVVDLPQASIAIRPILSRMEAARERLKQDDPPSTGGSK